MLFLLGFTLILILAEKKWPLKIISQTNSTSYFWLLANLVVLGFLIEKIQPVLNQIYAQFSLPVIVNFSDYTIAVQVILFILFFEFFKYLTHWLFHASDFLWKFHAVHHSSEYLDTLSSYKHSWTEAFTNILLTSLFFSLFAITEPLVHKTVYLFSMVCIFQHANINFSALKTQYLELIFITPRTHRLHHSKQLGSRRVNMGFVFSFWDRIFNTYQTNDEPMPSYGIDEVSYPYHSNLRQLIYPFFSLNQTKPQLQKHK